MPLRQTQVKQEIWRCLFAGDGDGVALSLRSLWPGKPPGSQGLGFCHSEGQPLGRCLKGGQFRKYLH